MNTRIGLRPSHYGKSFFMSVLGVARYWLRFDGNYVTFKGLKLTLSKEGE